MCPLGAIAQLVERYNGIVEVRGSIPLGSTSKILLEIADCGVLRRILAFGEVVTI